MEFEDTITLIMSDSIIDILNNGKSIELDSLPHALINIVK